MLFSGVSLDGRCCNTKHYLHSSVYLGWYHFPETLSNSNIWETVRIRFHDNHVYQREQDCGKVKRMILICSRQAKNSPQPLSPISQPLYAASLFSMVSLFFSFKGKTNCLTTSSQTAFHLSQEMCCTTWLSLKSNIVLTLQMVYSSKDELQLNVSTLLQCAWLNSSQAPLPSGA